MVNSAARTGSGGKLPPRLAGYLVAAAQRCGKFTALGSDLSRLDAIKLDSFLIQIATFLGAQ